jgi:hypothetical protein
MNGGAPIQLEASGFDIVPSSDLIKLIATGTISSLSVSALNVGSSLLYGGNGVIGGNGTPYVCSSKVQTFGAAGSLGTPGAKNETCFPYSFEQVDGAYEDITSTGTAIIIRVSNATWLATEYKIDLSSAPFPYFGTPRNTAWVTRDGELTFADAPPPPLALKDNPVLPSDAAAANIGMLAPFWDDLYPPPPQKIGGDVFVQYMPAVGNTPAHWVIQWSHFTTQNSPLAVADSNFEVKLFDDGSIEYHYGYMSNGSKSLVPLDGQTATIWLAAPDFSSALPVGRNESVLQDNTAFRFAPLREVL